MTTKLTTADYLALIDRIGYRFPEEIKRRVEAGDPATRFAVYGAALRKGLLKREGKPLSEGEIVSCACGATYNTASKVAKEHAGH